MNEAVKDELLMNIDQTVEIKAAPEKVFEGLITHLCYMEGEPGKPGLKLKLERKPGGLAGNTIDTNVNSSDWFAQTTPNPQSLSAPPVGRGRGRWPPVRPLPRSRSGSPRPAAR